MIDELLEKVTVSLLTFPEQVEKKKTLNELKTHNLEFTTRRIIDRICLCQQFLAVLRHSGPNVVTIFK